MLARITMNTNKREVPKYYHISQDIIGMIRSGRLKPGMQIPSENAIIKKYLKQSIDNERDGTP